MGLCLCVQLLLLKIYFYEKKIYSENILYILGLDNRLTKVEEDIENYTDILIPNLKINTDSITVRTESKEQTNKDDRFF